MNVKYYEEEKFFNAQLYRESDGIIFQLIVDELSKVFNVEWMDKIDSFDQHYRDFRYKGTILTLHLEHFLGISIHCVKTEENMKNGQRLLGEIGDHFKTWNPERRNL